MENEMLARNYQSKTDKQHVLDNPDTYVGSVETLREVMWIFDEASGRIVHQEMDLVPRSTSCLTRPLSIAAIM